MTPKTAEHPDKAREYLSALITVIDSGGGVKAEFLPAIAVDLKETGVSDMEVGSSSSRTGALANTGVRLRRSERGQFV